VQQAHRLRQSLVQPGGAIVAGDDGAERRQVQQRRGEVRQEAVRAGGVGLHDGDVTEAVDDQSRQAIGLGVHQPVLGARGDPGAEGRGVADPRPDPVGVDDGARVAVEQPGGDEAVRIEHERAVAPAVVAFDPHRRAGGPGSMLRIKRDLVAERPWMAAFEAAVLPGQQAEHGMEHARPVISPAIARKRGPHGRSRRHRAGRIGARGPAARPGP